MADGRFDAVHPSGGPGGRHDVRHRPPHRFRRQRARHLQYARCRPPPLSGSRSSSSPRPTRSTARSPAAACELRGNRYAYVDRPHGIGETEPLDFLSPYGCSKGAADQYALDFARIYKIPATSFRQSCIYGPRQFGVEDQGWVAWFAIASMLGRDITIFGDGKQVRDVLHVDDLLRAYEAAIRAPDKDRADRPSMSAAGPARSCRCSI